MHRVICYFLAMFLLFSSVQAQANRVATSVVVGAMETKAGQALLSRLLRADLELIQQMSVEDRSRAFQEAIQAIIEEGGLTSNQIDDLMTSLVESGDELVVINRIMAEPQYAQYFSQVSVSNIITGSRRARLIYDLGIGSAEYANLRGAVQKLQHYFPTNNINYGKVGEAYDVLIDTMQSVFVDFRSHTSRFRPVQWLNPIENLKGGVGGGTFNRVSHSSIVVGDILIGVSEGLRGNGAFVGVFKGWNSTDSHDDSLIVEIDGQNAKLRADQLNYLHVYDPTQTYSAEHFLTFWQLEALKHSWASGDWAGTPANANLSAWFEIKPPGRQRAGEYQKPSSLAAAINRVISDNDGAPVLMAFLSEVRGKTVAIRATDFSSYYTSGYQMNVQFVSGAEVMNGGRGLFVSTLRPRSQNASGASWFDLPPSQNDFFTSFDNALAAGKGPVKIHKILYLPTPNSMRKFNLTFPN